ncbi:hypothetical protein [Polymorphospora sp. NPDC050346]|uniref:hypothetical protein n=1 Tax=Polymorphospora sp. NPDC050346 TaxID=3155780 RepID=UPI0033E39213
MLPAHRTTGLDDDYEYRLDIVVDPAEDSPATAVGFNSDTLREAIERARQILHDHAGPDDRYGELWARTGPTRITWLDTIHLGQ